MKYSRFEALVLAVGFVAVAATILVGFRTTPIAEEIVAQILLFGVLFAAVRWGRSGGFLGALFAALIYAMLRIPLVLQQRTFTADIAMLVFVRVFTYGLIGIAGGELCSRIKYVFAKADRSARIDEWSGIYNQRAIVRSLELASGQFSRYDTPYSIVFVELSPELLAGLRTSRQRALIRGVANHIRGNVRIIDETGRLDDGRFLIVLPQTPRSGAEVVAGRLRSGTCRTLGAKDESVQVSVLGAPEDAAPLVELRTRLQAPYLAEDEAPVPAENQASGS